MSIEVQMKINSDKNLITFIRSYPIWYKRLNRNPNLFREFVLDMKDKYKLKTSDKIDRALNNISMIESLIEAIK